MKSVTVPVKKIINVDCPTILNLQRIRLNKAMCSSGSAAHQHLDPDQQTGRAQEAAAAKSEVVSFAVQNSRRAQEGSGSGN